MDEITKAGAVARAHGLQGFALNAEYHIASDDMKALGHALEGLERTLAELKAYQRREVPRFNMFARIVHGPGCAYVDSPNHGLVACDCGAMQQ